MWDFLLYQIYIRDGLKFQYMGFVWRLHSSRYILLPDMERSISVKLWESFHLSGYECSLYDMIHMKSLKALGLNTCACSRKPFHCTSTFKTVKTRANRNQRLRQVQLSRDLACLVPVRRLPMPSRSMHFGDVSKAWATWSKTHRPRTIMRQLES